MSDQQPITQLLLIRHGQSFYNRDGQEAGSDSGLTPLGWAQARRLAGWLAGNEPVDLLYTSPMRRARQVEADMQEDPDIERIGMQVTMDYEEQQDRDPEDVSDENLGFDVRSTTPSPTLPLVGGGQGEGGRKRYIEVKARAAVGPVALTQNEWFKAGRFASDYYLYVILNAATQPELYIIQDPAANLQPQERVEVRYLVGVEDILTGKTGTETQR